MSALTLSIIIFSFALSSSPPSILSRTFSSTISSAFACSNPSLATPASVPFSSSSNFSCISTSSSTLKSTLYIDLISLFPEILAISLLTNLKPAAFVPVLTRLMHSRMPMCSNPQQSLHYLPLSHQLKFIIQKRCHSLRQFRCFQRPILHPSIQVYCPSYQFQFSHFITYKMDRQLVILFCNHSFSYSSQL